MARRRPEPFWREARACYFVQIGKRQVRLDPDEATAWRLYHELMARPPEAKVAVAAPTLVLEVLDQFLDWVQKNKAPRTYAWYRENLQRFARAIPRGMKLAELKPFHVTRAMPAEWANNTKHDFISAVKRAFNWALDEELIERNPVGRMKKPQREAREMAVSPAEFAAVMAAIPNPELRLLVEAAWETGSRPQELRKAEARFVEEDRIVFPVRESKGKKYRRVIYLTARAREIVAELAELHPEGELFRNTEGRPWTKDAINCAFCRLQLALGRGELEASGRMPTPPKLDLSGVAPERRAEARAAHRQAARRWHRDVRRLAREGGKKFHLGAFRKGFATEALKKGVDTVTVAHLMGHRDPSMVSRVYGLVHQDPAHMREAAERAKRDQ